MIIAQEHPLFDSPPVPVSPEMPEPASGTVSASVVVPASGVEPDELWGLVIKACQGLVAHKATFPFDNAIQSCKIRAPGAARPARDRPAPGSSPEFQGNRRVRQDRAGG